jgi:nesprin-1
LEFIWLIAVVLFCCGIQSALLQEMTEEWEQCEKKLKDVKAWLEKARQTLESPLNKKRPLRDQLSLREKMVGDITIQKTKINMSIEKLQVHFRSGVTGSPDVVQSSAELVKQLDALLVEINEQSQTLEAAVLQLDQLQQVRIFIPLCMIQTFFLPR